MFKNLGIWLWNHSISFLAYLVILAIYLDYLFTLNINPTGIILTWVIWSILAIAMAKQNLVLRKLLSDIQNKDWDLIKKYLIMGINLKTSVILSILFFTYQFVLLVNFYFYLMADLYSQFGADTSEIRLLASSQIELILINGLIAVIGTVLHGILQNVEKEITNEVYNGHRY